MDEERLEFEVSPKSLALIQDASIEANFSELKKQLTEAMSDYKNLVITEEDIPNAKAMRAKIRKAADAIDEQRKSVKKAWNEPYTAFEAKCKELVGICNEASDNLDGQIKSYERRAKEAKLARLKAYWDENSGEAGQYATFEAIQNPKWENAGFKEDAAQEEIKQTIATIAQDIDTICGLESEFEPSLLTEYSKTRDIRAALQLQKTLEARKADLEARKSREAVKGETTPPKDENAAQAVQTVSDEESGIQKATARIEKMTEKIYTLIFQVSGTVHQMNELKAAFDRIGIDYYKL